MSVFEFIKNDICTFTVLNKVHLLKPGVNIIVSVFFKREKYYKNFAIYTRGLERLLKFVDDKNYNDLDNGGFVYLLFIDNHVANDPDLRAMIESCHNCVPVLFGCSEYIKDDYHIDLFGTLVRFFPMFDFDKNPCNIVICVDIDLHAEDYYRLQNLMEYKHKGITAAGDIARYLYMDLHPYIYAGLLCYNRKKMNHDTIINYIKNADKIESKGYYGKRNTTYGYGIDEIFINDYFLPKIGSINIIIDYQLSYFLFHSKTYMLEPDRIEKSSEILSIILGPYDKVGMTAEDKINYIDGATYLIHERTPKNDEISRRFSNVIKYLIENKKIWLEKKVQTFIYDYLLNVISANIIIEYNYKHGIVDVKKYEAIYDMDDDNVDLNTNNII